ncbi:class I SAM-dependent methyltransferase [Mesorhizobium sp. AR02]|uniref:class I SAM-dependent methyltransferase n=1 Tax=Mesorhizobium sp. AR02 TaxID=2865837 RepID=UPI00215EDB7C|nr:class I SAM-dependent methyltransferase [Mesorhizobium sp. AR02]UVK51419.1 class I SAM-dependent methyltransferase [Mesorhizobium sp. AR02]
MFASLECRVTSVDLCPEQIGLDVSVATALGYDLECVEADMLDLSTLHGRDFDLVYQAVSSCYIPDVHRLYTEVAKVLRPKGCYMAEHWSPAHMQLSDDRPWTGRGYELVIPYVSGYGWVSRQSTVDGQSAECIHYLHTHTALIGGLCDAGFSIRHFAERKAHGQPDGPRIEEHVQTFAPAFLSLYAQKISTA